ncbi:MAG: NADH-quinone oxidoreductase subunit M, partial [Candidatus Acidiferrales bacterium]
MQQPLLLTVLIFLPMAGVASLLTLRSDDHEWIRRLALVAALAEFLFSLLLLRGFDSANGTYQFTEFHNWIPSLGIH